jgi:tripartite-type tricarboxylate transporter receptor subunit TctC
MRLIRRRLLQFAVLAAGASALPQLASALEYPTRPVRWIVGFPAGGSADVVARLMAQWLSERLNQQFIIENRPGAGSNIAMEAAVKAPADGHTLVKISISNAFNATLYEKPGFDLTRDIAPIAGTIRVPGVMVVHPSAPFKTVSDFIAYAKANPGKVNVASGGNGSIQHIYLELFKMMARVNIVHVPYRGGAPALTDLLGGHAQVMFDTATTSMEHVRAGKLRPLAVTTATRIGALPDIPTVSEFVPGFEASGWQGVGAPGNTPADIIDKLNKEINAGLNDPRIKARIADWASLPLALSPAEFGRHIAAETEKWGNVIRAANIKAE